jgi:type VI secretion system protein ImpF
LRAYPESSRSLVSYGMPDFVGSSLVNPGDRRRLCASIEEALAVHEKRLTRISVVLEIEEGAVNRLCFVIHALLRVHSLAEPVYFDALLQPSTLQYACRHRPFAPR